VRVFVAGATGAIGRPLIERLREAGHEVVGTTRTDQRAETIRALGAEPAILDVRDTEALRAAVTHARPEVVINQLTRLPDRLNYRKSRETFGATSELRGKVGPALAGAAAEAGAHRLIAQSVCFLYASTGKAAHTEEDPLVELSPDTPAAQGTIALEALERSTLETPGLEGVVIRYGYFYGPGTHYAREGSWATTSAAADSRSSARATGSTPSSTSTTRPRRRSPRSIEALGSTTSATTSPPRWPNGCRPSPRRSARSARGEYPSGWRAGSPASRPP
jgi:nucleoside-diphosphate-sugar epimerase